ncbi:MAG TPA: ParA family protein [bacterium]|nr:ParA family protein [bacterium]HQL60985.1 ParA family protein [bacterium]
MVRIISIANQKGGVGKTTTAVNLAACLAAGERPVVLIDLDPQGNASSALGIDKRNISLSMFDVLVEQKPLKDVFQRTPVDLLTVAPANSDLVSADYHLAGIHLGAKQLQGAISRYLWNLTAPELPSYILIDCPPSVGYLTINALLASDSVIIPVQSEYFALEGLAELVDSMTLLRQQYNPKLSLEGILLTMFDARTSLSREVQDDIRGVYGDLVFQTIIRRSVRLSEAPSHGIPIILYDIRCHGSEDYVALAREIILNEKKVTRSWFVRSPLGAARRDSRASPIPGAAAGLDQ